MEPDQRDRVRAGDTAAFEALFERYAASVYNHAFRLTGSWSTAEEVVSLTFLEAWRLRGAVHADGGSLQPWLLGITVNVARNVRRAARRHQAAMSRLPPPPAVPDFAEELAGRLDDEAMVAATRTAVAGLRPREREVLALCVWSGLDYATAAETLGVPVGTVRSRLSRARRRLQKLAAASTPASAPGQPKSARPREDSSDEQQQRSPI
ncbi:MAG TPA: RNA polymerase sigma factor [Streptosporangiaceae bacterium]